MSTPASPPIRWLHLSDLHIRDVHGTGAQGDQQDVLDGVLTFLRDDLPRILGPDPGLDFIFITGDLAFSGTASDYTDGPGRTVAGFLDELLVSSGLNDKARLFVVPGNHDVCRTKILRSQAGDDVRLTEKALTSDDQEAVCNEIIDRLFTEDEDEALDRENLLKRHEHYVAFCKGYFPGRYPDLGADGPQALLPVLTYHARPTGPRHGTPIELVGLCTSWASQSRFRAYEKVEGRSDAEKEDPPASQFICLQTVRQAIGALGEGPFRIALMHHPPEWLVPPEEERLREPNNLFTEFDLVLTGHTHKAERVWNPPQYGTRALRSSAGAAFYSRTHYNAFNVVEVWPAERRARRMVVTWASGRWTPDPHLAAAGTTDPWVAFDLPSTEPGTAPVAPPPVAPGPDLGAYCRDVIQRSTIPLFAERRRHPQVDRLYVTMEVEYGEGPSAKERERRARARGTRLRYAWQEESGPTEDKEQDKQERPGRVRAALCEAVERHPAAVLVGGPGSGKTTTLRWLAARAASLHLHGGLPGELGPLEWVQGLVPVLITARYVHALRDQAVRKADDADVPASTDSLYEYLDGAAAKDIVSAQAPACARDAIENGQALLLVDGLDEVPGDTRRWIIHLAELFRPNRVLFSARPGGFVPREYAAPCERLDLLAFDLPRIKVYLDHWFAYRRAWTDQAISEREIARRRGEILDAVERTEGLREVARTPLLLSTMALVQEARIKLPDSRAALYDECTQLLLGRWTEELRVHEGDAADPETVALRAAIGNPDVLERRRLFEVVAHELFVAKDELNEPVPRDEMEVHLRRAIEQVAALEGRTPENAGGQAQAMLRLATRCSGLLVECEPEHFSFVHATFQEYLCARHIAGSVAGKDAGEWCKPLVDSAHQPRWREVIRLAAADLASASRADDTDRLNTLMDRLLARMRRRGWRSATWGRIATLMARLLEGVGSDVSLRWQWHEIADTATGCLTDLGTRFVPAALDICNEVIQSGRDPRAQWLPRAPVLRVPSCLARRGLLPMAPIEGLTRYCLEAARHRLVGDVWGFLRPLADDANVHERLAACLGTADVGRDRTASLLSGALLALCVPAPSPHHQVCLWAADCASDEGPSAPDKHIPDSEVAEWRALLQRCMADPDLFLGLSRADNALKVWPVADWARAAVRAFSRDSSRGSGERVMRALVGDAATRAPALDALRQGLEDRDGAIAGTSAALLSEIGDLPPDAGARAAVRAFSRDSSRGFGVRVIRKLAEDASTRAPALDALRQRLEDRDPDIAGTSAALLAEVGNLPPRERAWSAVRAFSRDSSRGLGVRVIRELAGKAATWDVAVESLRRGLENEHEAIASTSKAVLAEIGYLSGMRRAPAFHPSSTRGLPLPVIRRLLADPATREVALEELRKGTRDRDSDIRETCKRLLAEAGGG